MRSSLYLFVFTASLQFVAAQDLTEAQALQLISDSPRAAALALQIELAHASALTEGLAPNGNLTISRETSGGVPETYLLYEQPLSVTGRRQYLRRAALSSAESESNIVQGQLHDLRVDVRLAFLELLLVQEQLSLYDSELAHFQEIIGVLKKRELAGESSGYDRIRAERELSLLEADQGAAQARLESARGTLACFFGVSDPPQTLRAIGTLALPSIPDFASLLTRVEKRGDIQAENKLAESARFLMEAARRKGYPEPVVSGGLKSPVINGQRDSGYVLSVTVPLPIFDRGKTEITRAELARRTALARAEALRSKVELVLKSKWDELQARIHAAEIYKNRAVGETADMIKISRAAYEGGEAGILELLDAYRTQREVHLRLQELTAAARQSALELERLAGEEVIP
jgi:outer membrane protein, heavy metal efflux system